MKFVYTALLLCLSLSVSSQQTVGLFDYQSSTAEGYTLFNPIFTQNTFLIDNCGRIVNQWDFAERHGVSAYLTPQGDLLRAAQYADVPSPVLRGGGAGGRVQLVDWDGTILWQFDYSQDFSHRQHHDVELLPNGNVLVLAWEYKTAFEAEAAGRDTALLGTNGLWPEMIIEVEPTGATTGNIVWEWHLWDHIIQDRDASLPNFGSPAANRGKLDINFVGTPDTEIADWLHANSIDYNAATDEILLSSPYLHEIYIIDHSQSTAATAGAAGDFKWRWGNPQAYGSSEPQQLFFQHDAKWISDSLDNGGKIMVFNNGEGRQPVEYSSIDLIAPIRGVSGNYAVNSSTNTFMPLASSVLYQSSPTTDFYSSFISGAQTLANGNILICEGDDGHIFEVDPSGNTVWDYVNPMTNLGPLNQGDPIPNVNPIRKANIVFRAEKYDPNFSGFVGKDLTPGLEIEGNPIGGCSIFVSANEANERDLQISVFPNPASELLTIQTEQSISTELLLIDVTGKVVLKQEIEGNLTTVDVQDLPSGMYFLRDSNSLIPTQRVSIIR